MDDVFGCDLSSGEIASYNKTRNAMESFNIKKLEGNADAQQIEEFFKELQGRSYKKVHDMYVYMNSKYSNNFRKNFVECAKTQSYINSVRIICEREILLFGAIDVCVNIFPPEIRDFLWVFNCQKEKITCNVWKFNEEKQWKFEDSMNVKKTFNENNPHPAIDIFEKFKLLLNKYPQKPYICVFHEHHISQVYFMKVFTDYKELRFEFGYKIITWLINFAKFIFKKENFLKYKSDVTFGREMEIKLQNVMIFDKNLSKELLPFTKTFKTLNNDSDVIEVYENDIKAEAIPIEKGENWVTLVIDINGIYSIKVVPCD